MRLHKVIPRPAALTQKRIDEWLQQKIQLAYRAEVKPLYHVHRPLKSLTSGAPKAAQ